MGSRRQSIRCAEERPVLRKVSERTGASTCFADGAGLMMNRILSDGYYIGIRKGSALAGVS